ncbi:MAG TPA: excinuclease ABC subunit UvrA [Myxococcales bacterium]
MPTKPTNAITVRGAHEHNLQHVDVDLPRDSLIVVTGVSGSGKSSLAFDTLFREGQRRYLETFPSYARQLLGKLERPAVEHIHGLSPALAVDQKSTIRNPRSTVGTLSELHPYLRLLFARLGTATCSACGGVLDSVPPERLAAQLSARYAGRPFAVLAQLVDGHKGAFRAELSRARDDGFQEARLDGAFVPLSALPSPDASAVHQIELVVARFDAPPGEAELRACLERAQRASRPAGVIKVLCGETLERFSTALACASCGAPAAEVGPRLFSFNSSYGACPACTGLGVQDAIDPELFVADAAKTLRQGCLVLSTPTGYLVYSQVTIDVLDQVCQAHGFSVDIPWKDLTEEHRRVVLYGSDRIKVPFGKHPLENRLKWKGITARPREEGTYKGIVPTIEEILKRNRNENALRFVRSKPCAACTGRRLRPEALAVLFRERSIADLCALSLDELHAALESVRFAAHEAPVGKPILDGLLSRLSTLRKLGLGYLPLERDATSLSGGEAQRIRLATQADCGLRGILYVLDEPSIGLHSRDTQRLLGVLTQLRDLGNTVLVVEHDQETIDAADWIVDIGPAAGRHGGKVLYSGKPPPRPSSGPLDTARDRTGGEPGPARLDPCGAHGTDTSWLVVRGARHHNLRGIDVPFRLAALNVVTGVSGAGKSSLVRDTLARTLRRKLHGANELPGAHDAIEGADSFDKVIEIDQAPIGRTPRSNPATYTGLADPLRDLFAALPEAKARGWGKGRFSFNVAGGRCEACGGAGVQSIGMHFLSDVEVVCEECGGRRFNDETLSVKWNGLSVGDALELTVEEAAEVFADFKPMRRVLEAMRDVGLGYLTLGQPATTLSGGEAQRVKLSAELGRASTGNTLYVLDEPTTGLHAKDVQMLLKALHGLVGRGNTVITIEHHLDVVHAADWVVDLGPEGGAGGGQLVVAGSPAEVATCEASFTGKALAGTEVHSVHSVHPVHGPGGPSGPSGPEPIRLRGVATHNLKQVDLDIPVGKLTVITGVSGSGKSSLAFDTLFHESQRRFTDSLSTYVRRYVPRARPAELEEASGLFPAIAVGQHLAARNPRSTVGTLTEVYDDYRLLFSRAGVRPGTEAGRGGLTARMFSFNHVQGACPRCKGLGLSLSCDPAKLVTDPSRSLFEGALDGTKTGEFYADPQGQHLAILEAVGAGLKLDFKLPWSALGERARSAAMFGTGDAVWEATWHSGRKSIEAEHVWKTTWKGLVGYVDEEYERKHADERGEALLPLMRELPCDACRGERLRPEMRAVRLAGVTLPELVRKSVGESVAFLEGLPLDRLGAKWAAVTADAREQALVRLRALREVGLEYLSLDRAASTLSGGELQRVRLATQLGSGLRGVTYVLDEPTIGLHSRDTASLLKVLRRLCDEGNTVVVVEHDPEVIRAADHLVDLGPGAGRDGGRIVAAGSVSEVRAAKDSRTGRYLADPGRLLPVPKARRAPRGSIRVEKARANNLHLDCDLPTGVLLAVTGVSGSGKSTLVFEVLHSSFVQGRAVGCARIDGLEQFQSVVLVDQQSLSGGPWSTPATYLGIFDPIRDLFAKTELAKSRKWAKSRFSLATKGGRCEACQGSGRTEVRMDFLPDVWLPCEECQGARFAAETLQVDWRGQSIAEVLDLTVAQARSFFADQPKIAKPLAILEEAGLGYVALGQPTSTLSGGEAQRLRLAAELAEPLDKLGVSAKGNILYLFDEPTTGLHPEDVARLLAVLQKLVDQGHSVVVVEHHLDVIKAADLVVDLGPEGGARGGSLVAAGTPEAVSRVASATGLALRGVLG